MRTAFSALSKNQPATTKRKRDVFDFPSPIKSYGKKRRKLKKVKKAAPVAKPLKQPRTGIALTTTILSPRKRRVTTSTGKLVKRTETNKEGLNDEEKKSLQSQNQKLVVEAQGLRHQYGLLNKKCKVMEHENKLLKTTNKSLQQTKIDCEANGKIRLESLRTLNNSLQSSHDALESKHNKLKSEHQTSDGQVERIMKDNDNLKTALAEQATQLKNAKDTLEEQTSQLKNVKNGLKKQTSQLKNITTEHAKMKKDYRETMKAIRPILVSIAKRIKTSLYRKRAVLREVDDYKCAHDC